MADKIPTEWYQAPYSPLEEWGFGRVWETLVNGIPTQMIYQPAQYYSDILSGALSPYSEPFRKQVYEATREEALANLERMQKEMARRFAHTGGYFGGKHALAQAELARGTGLDLAKLLAELNLRGLEQDVASRFQAGTGLSGLAPLLTGLQEAEIERAFRYGGMQRAREQEALDKIYQDWLRARQENLMPFNILLSALGQRTLEPGIVQPQPSPWSYLLQGLGQGLGSLLSLLFK